MYSEFVYILKAGPYYKIGRTNDVTRRIADLAIQLPFRVELFKVFNTNDSVWLEAKMQDVFVDSRVNGEWFTLDAGDAGFLMRLPACFPVNDGAYFSQQLAEAYELADRYCEGFMAQRLLHDWQLQRLCCFGV